MTSIHPALTFFIGLGAGLFLTAGLYGITALAQHLRRQSNLKWDFLSQQMQELARNMHVDGYRPSLIVGAGRGGSRLGALLAGHLTASIFVSIHRRGEHRADGGMDFQGLDRALATLPKSEDTLILLVTDVVRSGKSFRRLLAAIREKTECPVRTMAYAVSRRNSMSIDYVFVNETQSVKFPWSSSRHHGMEKRTAMDDPPSFDQTLNA